MTVETSPRPHPSPPDDLQGTGRLRPMSVLFTGVALTTVALTGASAVSTLIAADAVGDRWSGTPNALAVLGTAIATLALGSVMARRGHRAGLAVGYLLAAVGAAVALGGVLTGALPLLLVGMIGVGAGNGSAQLARYSAAELYPRDRKGFALSLIVWAGTIGGIVGPLLISPTAHLAERLSMPAHAGPFLLTIVAVGAAAAASAALPRAAHRVLDGPRRLLPRGALRRALRTPAVGVAISAMVVAQLDMVAVMTMTPVHLDHHGHGLGTVGTILTIHVMGMFALSPLSGRLADRYGGTAVILAGIAVLVAASGLVAVAPDAHTSALPLALFLLGYGWNLAFVGGSSLLSRHLPADTRTQIEGMIDALVWGSSALASLGSGVILQGGGYVVLALTAGAIVVVPLIVIAAARARPTDAN
ncbi:MFS transporter [Phytoactinopolyspora halotolerans]|uniref:MFS transporter n=1 Tax=Phytoactinopolyspora halotolerans TaxID=1981512 RepID=A0A6L9SC21_9ACTN|nr:MFS transporter [Phytoactinopolyspora halotolerans]NEE02111.1 MFS transporter [Phytoactinopolyspora halotolerans]